MEDGQFVGPRKLYYFSVCEENGSEEVGFEL